MENENSSLNKINFFFSSKKKRKERKKIWITDLISHSIFVSIIAFRYEYFLGMKAREKRDFGNELGRRGGD